MSYYHATGSRSGAAYTLTTPTSATNGAGANTAVNNMYFPIFRAHNLVTGAVANMSMTLNTGANFNVFNMAGLSSADSTGIRLQF